MYNSFKYSIIEDIDYTFEEKGNQFGTFRKVQWGDNPKEYLEIRKYRNAPDGTEQAAKGYTFMTEEGPSELTKVLLNLGFGNTREVINIIKTREDFRKSLNSELGPTDEMYDESVGTLEDDFYDPKSFLEG